MKKHLLLLGLMAIAAQPALSQGGCPLGGCPQAAQPVYQQPDQQQVYHQAQPIPQAAQPVYHQAMPTYQAAPQVNTAYPQRAFYYNPNPQCMTGAAASLCPKERGAWDIFVEDFLGFD